MYSQGQATMTCNSMPLQSLKRLDAGAQPFQPGAAQYQNGPAAVPHPLGDATSSFNQPAMHKGPFSVGLDSYNDAQGGEHGLLQRERWARSRIARMELTEAARIEMHLQNLNVKRSAGMPSGMAPVSTSREYGYSGQPQGNTCVRPEGPDGEPIYEFNNGLPGGVCVYFMKGYCSLGNRCRYVHDASDPGHIVKVTGMPYNATPEDVVHFFHPLDIVPGGVTFLHSMEGRPTGSAFVEFRDRPAALVAVGKDRAFFAAHRFVLIFASSKKEREWFLNNPQAAGQPRVTRNSSHHHSNHGSHCAHGSHSSHHANQATPPPQQGGPRTVYIVRRSPEGSQGSSLEQQFLHQQLIIQEQQQQIQQQQMMLQMRGQKQLLPSPAPGSQTVMFSPQTTPYASAVNTSIPLSPALQTTQQMCSQSMMSRPAPTPLSVSALSEAGSGTRRIVIVSPQRQGCVQDTCGPSPVRDLLPHFETHEDSSFEADSPPKETRAPQVQDQPIRSASALDMLSSRMQGGALLPLASLPQAEQRSVLSTLGYDGQQQELVIEELRQLRQRASAIHSTPGAQRFQQIRPQQPQPVQHPAGPFENMPPLVPDHEIEDEPAC